MCFITIATECTNAVPSSRVMFKASSHSKQIRFDCHPIFSKWGKPNIYGSGKLYDFTLKESKCQHKSTGPALLTYSPAIALPLCKKMDELNKPMHLNYQRHLIEMQDGGKVGVDEVTDSSISNVNYPNILYMPAGGVTSYSPRSKIWSSWFLEAGYPRVFIWNRRCSSKVLQHSPQISIPYGQYNDIHGVMNYLSDYLPNEKWIIIGSCFGAQFVLDFFSQPSSDRHEVLGGIVDGFQFSGKTFLKGMRTTKSLLFKSARKIMGESFVDAALNHAADKDIYNQVSHLVDREKFKGFDCSTGSLFKLVTEELLCKMCPDAPFSNEEEYHAMTCPYYDENHKGFLNIKKPVAMILSQDDPFSPFDLNTIEILKENPNLCLWLYAGGGHISFTEKLFPYTSYLKDVYLENANLLIRKQDEL